ncbi:galactokinase [Nocardia transvalensis]|uniref:galactokinase n=1 Tax=Nocardia transvalensis TaxID=37333 RepID=UPI00189487C5|nr:galactokinase [Nocardia transvalensis]MBF6332885.1 galactokinase [Nocardia transvalensis]
MKGVWVAPGRVNIIGEHTDYNGGYALPIALPHVVTCTAETTTDGLVRVSSRQHPDDRVRLPLTEVAEADIAGWARYPLGVVHEYLRRGRAIPGVTLHLDGAVPVGAGLSSSAAVECSVAIAMRDLFALPITDSDLIDIGRAAENTYVGAATGTLDQSASVLCTAGHALFLDFATGERAQVPFDLAATGAELLVVDTDTPHQLADGGYARRRQECEQAAAALGVRSLREITDVAAIARLTDPVLRRRARHIVTENARVLTVVEMLRDGRDPRRIGPILTTGHASLRDDFEISTPQLDTAVEAALAAGAHGARMVGGGFGGSIIALTDADRTRHIAAAVEKRFAAAGFTSPRTFVAVPSAGAHRVS